MEGLGLWLLMAVALPLPAAIYGVSNKDNTAAAVVAGAWFVVVTAVFLLAYS